jgi:hypothetical protein
MASSAAISLCFLSLLIDNPASTHLLKVVDDYVLIHLIRWVPLFLVFPLIQVPLLLRSSPGAGGPLAIDAGLAVLHVRSVFLIQILGFLFHGGL